MPNGIKYTVGSTEAGCLRKGNMLISNNTADTGATFFTGITPPPSGYTIYLNKASGGPSIYCPANDTQLINITNRNIAGTVGSPAGYTTVAQCLEYFATQTDKLCVNFNYEGIVTNGLVLNYDAGFDPSYPTTGSTWYDLSGNANNTTLVNGPTFNSANSGSIIFDGIDDYCNIATTQMTSNIITITGFIKWLTSNDRMFFGFTTYDVWTLGNTLGYNTGGGDVYGISSATVSSLGLVGNWVHYTFVMTSTNSIPTNNKIYINGNLQTLSQQYGTTGNAPGFGGTLKLCDWVNGGYYGNMQYGNLQVYNRELTQAEVTQNYNAQKGRFGL
jgi:hypothetical protein